MTKVSILMEIPLMMISGHLSLHRQQIANAPTTDWLDKVLKTGAVTNHNLTISGGSEKFKYYLGVNYYKEDATVHNSDMERYSLRTNITSQLTNFLKLTTIVI